LYINGKDALIKRPKVNEARPIKVDEVERIMRHLAFSGRVAEAAPGTGSEYLFC